MRAAYSLPEEDCERLTRTEMQAMQMGLAALNVLVYCQDDLKNRLDCIPSGKSRMRMLIGSARAIFEDLTGTITKKQAKHILNTMKDMEMRIVPKLTSGTANFVMEKETGKALIDCARAKCHGCVEDGDSCRKCKLYEILTVMVPLEGYSDFICPYALAEWEE